GTLNYVMGVRPRTFLQKAVPVVIVYSVVTAFLPGVLLNGVMLLQAPLVAGPFILCSWLLLRLPASRGTLGSRGTGAVFGMISVLWLGYALAFAMGGIPALQQPSSAPLDFLLQYNSYLDLLLQVLLGYGMVVVLLEDAKREADDARAQLSVAHDRLKRVSLYDPLTGALNRRAYQDGVGLEAVGARFGTAMMLDMDNLKAVNDAYGHAAGDELLRRLVETIRASVRPLDRVYRWGGDEFLVLFPAALPADVVPRIRAALHEANRAAGAQAGLAKLEVSIGAADFAGAEGIDGAILRADKAMYEEKARNRRLTVPVYRIA
ncbi:MAG TPA: GGDEF domain-containing protein, partial [Longimicrobium sp.]|nr:GGDEF domain-containing protein [Longimicrobium sp.]